jgi:hypothetical protein
VTETQKRDRIRKRDRGMGKFADRDDSDRNTDRDTDRDRTGTRTGTWTVTRTVTRTGTRIGTRTGTRSLTRTGTRAGTWTGTETKTTTADEVTSLLGLQDIKSIKRLLVFITVYLSDGATLRFYVSSLEAIIRQICFYVLNVTANIVKTN